MHVITSVEKYFISSKEKYFISSGEKYLQKLEAETLPLVDSKLDRFYVDNYPHYW